MGSNANIYQGFGNAGQGVATVIGANAQASAIRLQGEYQQQQYQLNARFAEQQAEDAIARGARDASKVGRRTRQIIGAQRAAYAAQGVDVNTGSAAEVQEETAALGALDELTVRNNAVREAFGYRAEGIFGRGRGTMSKLAAESEARGTLLTGGLKAAGYAGDAVYKFGSGIRVPMVETSTVDPGGNVRLNTGGK